MDPQPIIAIPGFAEPVSSMTHLGGAFVAALMGIFLLRRSGRHFGRLASMLVFTGSCVFLFSMSGVYHLLDPGTTARTVMQRLDHAAIFVLIAGTFTPPHVILFRGFMRWGMLLLMWSAVAAGITLKTIWFDDLPEWAGLSMYLALGWLGAVSTVVFWFRHGAATILRIGKPLAWGGFFYTTGALLEFFRVPTLIDGVLGPHELFHIAVMLGALSHWIFLYRIARGVNLAGKKNPAGRTAGRVSAGS